jgi:hypothetical protein
LTNQTRFLVLDYNALPESGTNPLAFAVIQGELAANATQVFERTLHPFLPALPYQSASCAGETFILHPASAVFAAPPSAAERGLTKIRIEAPANVQTPRVCRLRLTVETLVNRRVDLLLNYDAFDGNGGKIASVSFPLMLDGGITLEHTWTRDEQTSLASCAEIASFRLNVSSYAF